MSSSLQVLLAATAAPAAMDMWVPLSSDLQDPVLDFSSFSISSQNTEGSPDLLVQVQQVHQAPLSERTGSFSEEPSSPSCASSPNSSIDSHSGFYSLVDDPSSPEAELNTAWMVSAQRQNQLATLKEERAFKLQTYSSSRKPRSLFQEEVGRGDAHHPEKLKAGVEVLLQEEHRRLRQEIIRSQAPRKKTQDLNLDLGSSGLLDDLSPVHSKQEPLAQPAAGAVDKEQINFKAARQQFLRMEQQNQQQIQQQNQPNLLDSLSPSIVRTRSCPTQGVASSEQQENQDIAGPDQFDLQRKDSSRSQDLAAIETTSHRRPNAGLRSRRSTRDQETPIQRKIRLVQEREEKLLHSHELRSSDDQVQVQVTSNHLNSVFNLVPVQQEVQTGSKNHRRDSRILRLYSLEAPQKLEERVDDRFSSPCCPHRHSEEMELLLSQRTSAAPSSPRVQETKGIYQERLTSPFSHVLLLSPSSSPGSWRENLESSGLQSREQGTSNFIQQEIEESLRREQELRELRASRTQFRSFESDPLVIQTSKGAINDLNLLRPAGIYLCSLRLFWFDLASVSIN